MACETDPAEVRCRLEFRPPLAWDHLLAYLRLRAVPEVESVDATHYRRTAQIDGHVGWIGVSLAGAAGTGALELVMSQSLAPVAAAVTARVGMLCDLSAMPQVVAASLSQDPLLRAGVARLPGLRVPRAFDGFELGVRAILGQQVSVKAATTIAGRYARRFGAPIATPHPQLTRLTPTAAQMSRVAADDIAATGVVGSRARSIVALAHAVEDRQVTLADAVDVGAQIDALLRLPGIGPWTAQYIAMRALNWPDAFPGTDLMLLRAAGLTAPQLQARAEAWRPWRAYATHHLWQSLGVAT